MNRKDFLKWFGISTAGMVGSFSLSGWLSGRRNKLSQNQNSICETPYSGYAGTNISNLSDASGFAVGDDGRGSGAGLLQRTGNAYGSMVHPPSGLHRNYLSNFERPINANFHDWLFSSAQIEKETGKQSLSPWLMAPQKAISKKRDIEIHSVKRPINVAHGVIYNAWTFNGRLPGPVIRATEGETLNIRFRNLTKEPHSVHFHGSHNPNQDGWEPIPGGQDTVYTVKAGPAGLHPYHCHVPPLAVHMSRGLFGALIVDPPNGRPLAHEVVLILNGYDIKGQGRNDIYSWNGIAGFYDRFPIRVKVGQLVRVYVVNMLEYEPLASFHLHAQTFDVYRSGTRHMPDAHTDVITLGQTERAILEFRLPHKGRYMFHPHQIHMAERGAMGWFVAV